MMEHLMVGDTMNSITNEVLVDLLFSMNWTSDVAKHTECYQASQVNMWRDFLPEKLLTQLYEKQTGDQIKLDLNTSEIIGPVNDKKLMTIKRSQIKNRSPLNKSMPLKIGRFYPLGILKDIPGVFSANREPFRCTGINNGHLSIDLNHPIANKNIALTAFVGGVESKRAERGGTSVAWLEDLLKGPGMQTKWHHTMTDYFSGHPFERDDEKDDALFYKQPRFVQHIDDNAIEVVKSTYGRFLEDGMNVLDLMSSWTSHLPEGLKLKRLSGLGMNELELRENKALSDYLVQDLNKNKSLSYAENSFDAVICTVSIEYVVDPFAIFKEVRRVLKPGGVFVVTVSNRWFPPKAIKIWKELHEFERMGLILEYFLRAGGYESLNTYSMRGLPRPTTDKYFPQQRYSDPVYAVWGVKKGVLSAKF
jgi:SAM-dependent methyltransferase